MSLNPARYCIAAAALSLSALAAAQAPAVVTSSLSVRPLHVAAIVPAAAADLVVLDGGYAAGWRQGMAATVDRDGTPVARVRFAALRRDRSVALITDIEPGSTLRTGDRVTVNTLLSTN